MQENRDPSPGPPGSRPDEEESLRAEQILRTLRLTDGGAIGAPDLPQAGRHGGYVLFRANESAGLYVGELPALMAPREENRLLRQVVATVVLPEATCRSALG